MRHLSVWCQRPEDERLIVTTEIIQSPTAPFVCLMIANSMQLVGIPQQVTELED